MKIETEKTTTYRIDGIELKAAHAVVVGATVTVTKYHDEPDEIVSIDLRSIPLTKSGKPDKRATPGYVYLQDDRPRIEMEVAEMTGDKRVELYAKDMAERHKKYKEELLKELGIDK